MANFSINLTLNWENRDELQRLLQNVTKTQQAFQNALKELSEFEPEIHVVSENGGEE
ncbi:TPA: hypothetical protein ACGO9H_001566 [Streptococcus suis]